MAIHNYNHGKFFGPSSSYAGYVLIAAGIFTISYSLITLTLIIPGIFMAFTYTGTILDTDNRRVKPYTSLFGIFRTGKWIDINQFTRFTIQRATRRYTSYSRANVRFDMGISDIKLLLIYRDGIRKIVINRYSTFEEAQSEMKELTGIIFPQGDLIIQ